MAWINRQPEPRNVGEPQSVRNAYDKHLAEHEEVEQEAEAE